MKIMIPLSLLLVALVLLFPLIFAAPAEGAPVEASPSPSASPAASPSPQTSPDAAQTPDAGRTVTVSIDGQVTEMSMADYLVGVVAAEMPASFEPEALKAQAVAARTYTLYRAERTTANHPDAQVCNDVTCCKAYASLDALAERWGDAYTENLAKITAAVQATDGQVLLYEGEPILAVFHASSGSVWSQSLPYLVPVDSPETAETVPNLLSTVTVSLSDFTATVLAQYPTAVFGEGPGTWLGTPTYSEGGRVSTIAIGGVELTGNQVRSLFALRSAAFTVSVDGEAVTFQVTGYGHGVGMSQYGANLMAKAGSDYQEILLHYYTGAALGYA